VQLLEPGAVASGGAERARVHLEETNPYRPLLDQLAGFRGDPIGVEEVANAVAAGIDDPNPPLRVAIGPTATAQLSARKAAPEGVPFVAAPLAW
jgi:hypothetical protein